ncbi:MAG: Ldh family oxidoreductase [Pseudomonadota bacterium]
MSDTVAVAALTDWMRDVFLAAGMTEAYAQNSADVLGYASASGIDSHGVIALPRYLSHFESGRLHVGATADVIVDHKAVLALDGNLSLGVSVGPDAMRGAIKKARAFGVGVAAVRNSSHFGAAGYYTHLAAGEACVGISTSNVEPIMPPFAASEKLLGNNPFSIGAPGVADEVHQIDFGTSKVAWGKLQLAFERGEAVPDSWARDQSGNPTSDPQAGMNGMLNPLGEHKGSGLAFMLEVLNSTLPGGVPAFDVVDEVGIGQCHIAIDVEAFGSAHQFRQGASALAARVRTSTPARAGETVKAPGDPEAATRAERGRAGVPLLESVRLQLDACAQRYGVRPPWA